jgi:preprotein translocase subunit SecY
MGLIDKIGNIIPEVAKPDRKLGFAEKMKWTLIILALFFVLGVIPLFGVGTQTLDKYANLAVLLGAKIGSIVTLGIGPLVTASIIMQLLNGSGIIKFDLSSHEGKSRFQTIQKILSYCLVVFEACIYVFLGGLSPDVSLAGTPIFLQLQLLIILQMSLGGVLIIFMDEVCQKWGIGSGLSLFIAAGVSQSLFVRMFSWVKPAGSNYSVGAVWSFIQALGAGETKLAILSLSAIAFTLLVFALAIYVQSMKVEIPLSFGRMRGHGIRWPLNFLYTSNIPVILIAALLANVQIFSHLLSKVFTSIDPAKVQPWISGPQVIPTIIQNGSVFIGWHVYGQAITYFCIFLLGAVVFSWFWVQTSGMDAKTQARNITKSGLQIPGFRTDPRIVETVLERYISPLTIMGAIAVAILATFADMSGALSSGTGILLTVMIIYKFYQDIAKQHMEDMNPMVKGFMGGD